MVEAGGGEIITNADVKEIKVANGRATGVKLADGRTIDGRKFVASAIDFPTTMQMTGEELFPDPVREKAKSWHWGNHSLVTLHLALKNPPAYRAAALRSRCFARLQYLLRHGSYRRRCETASRIVPRKDFPAC